MTGTRFFSTQNIRKKLLPFLFTAVIVASVINVFIDSYINVYLLLCAAMIILLFAAFDYIAAHKKIGPFIYIFLGFTALTAIILIMSTAPRGMWFAEWFLTGGATVDTVPQYMLVTVIAFSFFFSSVIYYFTHMIYRVSILTLIGLIPCAVYVKAAKEIPAVYPLLIAAVNIFLYISLNRNIFASRCVRNKTGKAAELTAYIDFAVAAVLLAAIIPKPEVTPYYEQFEAFTSRFNFGGRARGVSGEYTRHSGNADNYNELESKLLYVVSSERPQYLKIQTFDEYDERNGYWTLSRGLNEGVPNGLEGKELLSYSALFKSYQSSGSEILGGVRNGFKEILSSSEDTLYRARIRAVDYPSVFAVTPLRITKISFTEMPAVTAYCAPGGEVWPDTRFLAGDAGYDAAFYDSGFAAKSGWISSGLCNISYEEYGELLSSLEGSAAEAFYESWQRASAYSAENYPPVPDGIKEISDKITEGLTYDWEKAYAIEEFFLDGSFTYDLAYKAPEENDTPLFFITESKRGTCSDFATAYCLLARAAGLKVRFAEGFNEGEAAGAVYQIYTENAHAYPEVYIPGADWMIYEPTVSGGGRRDAAAGGDGGTDLLTVLVTCAVVFVLLGILALMIIFAPAAEEKIFSLRIKFMPTEKGVILVYGRFTRQCARIYGISSEVMTAEQLSGFINEKTGFSPDKLTSVFEKVCYGKQSAGKNELAESYDCYRNSVKLLKKAKRAAGKKREKRILTKTNK